MLALAALLCAPIAQAARAGDDEAAAWDVNQPPGERIKVPLDVSTGTWMNVDVSPDGRHIVFDLLGDLYEIPIAGGTARALTRGLAWDMQPRYAPDGRRIAFTSDRGGADNVWLLDREAATTGRRQSSAPRPVTDEDFRLPSNPAWHPDGHFLAARKHFTTRRSLGAGEIWLYAPEGGEGVPVVERPNDRFQKELGEPVFAPDGRALYYTQNTSPGNVFEYAQDSNRGAFSILRYDLTRRETTTVITGAGGAARPTPSPDGLWLAFVQRERRDNRHQSALYVKNLVSGAEQRLHGPLDRDMQEAWAVHGVYPNMAWLPDSSGIVFWSEGRIQRVNLATLSVTDIPFRVVDSRDAIKPFRAKVEVAPDTVRSRMARFPVLSPDGRSVVFESFGRLWLRALPDGKPQRLTDDAETAFELYPSFSRDGTQIAFVRWTDAALGEIRVVPASGGTARAVTRDPGHYLHPRFSPDGEELVFEAVAGGDLTAPEWSEITGILRVPVAGGAVTRVVSAGRDAHFGADGARIYFTRDVPPATESGPAHDLVSVTRDGLDPQVIARSAYATRMLVSPDQRWLLFREHFHIYAVPLPPAGTLELSKSTTALPLRRLSRDGGEFPAWSGSSTATFALGASLFTADLAAAPKDQNIARRNTAGATRRDEAGKRDESEHYATARATLSIERPADTPRGRIALVNARIVTMDEADTTIDNGTILIQDNRIAAIGPATLPLPPDTRTLDLGGRTVLPGFIDAHAHGPQGANGLIPEQNWSALAHLAFGVTTVHDPSNDATEIFAAAEYQRAGLIVAPRIFSTGDVVYGARSEGMADIKTLADARGHIARLKAQGAISIKNYNQPRRDQRQMVVTAAREAGLSVVAEGGSLYTMDITLLQDGNTGLEHNMPGERFYEDVMTLWPATGVGYTPTLVVTYGGLGVEHYYYQRDEVWRHPLLARFVPPDVLEARAVRRTLAPESDYQPVRDAAASARALAEQGIAVNIGAHGQREGLAAHWEMWAFTSGGMSNLQALATATRNPARYLGLDADLGSIEPGKLADLVVVEGNPLQDIETTQNIAFVIQNGRVLTGGTLAETVTGSRTLKPFWWQRE